MAVKITVDDGSSTEDFEFPPERLAGRDSIEWAKKVSDSIADLRVNGLASGDAEVVILTDSDAAVGEAGTVKLRYAEGELQQSVEGAAYEAIGAAGSSEVVIIEESSEAVSSAGTIKLRFNSGELQQSIEGAAYEAVGGGAVDPDVLTLQDSDEAVSDAGEVKVRYHDGLMQQSADGADYRSVSGAYGIFYPEDFGAIRDDDEFDCTPAIQDAIEAAHSQRGGTVQFSYGDYFCSSTIYLNRGVKLRGVGISHDSYSGTQLWFPATVLGIKIGSQASGILDGSGGVGGGRCVVDGLYIGALAKDATSTTATTTENSPDIELADATNFNVGDWVRIEGAGMSNEPVVMRFTNISTTEDSPDCVIVTNDNQSGRPIHPGAWITAGDAFPTPTRIASLTVGEVDGLHITMASNAAATLAMQEVTLYTDFVGEIISKVGNVITTNTENTEPGVARPCYHCEPGIALYGFMARVENCVVANWQGAAVHVMGSIGQTPYTNANLWQMENCQLRGTSWCGLYIYGADANAGVISGCDFGQYRYLENGWGVMDFCMLGNTYVGCHVDGPNGYLFRTAGAQNACMLGCYIEGSTTITGNSSLIVGGTMRRTGTGGYISSLNGGVFINELQVGNTSEDDYAFTFDPGNNVGDGGVLHEGGFTMRSQTGEPMRFGKLPSDGSGGTPNWWGLFGDTFGSPILWSDDDTGSIPGGNAWFQQGFYIGTGSGPPTIGNARRMFAQASIPVSGTYVAGDICINLAGGEVLGAEDSEYTLYGWRCTSAGTPGTWVEMRMLTGT